jgi:electron transfer flavoprotein alpha subunit
LVKKVITVEAAYYENFLAENFAPVVTKLADNYSHIVCSANTFGKNLMPRIAAKLDTSQVSDIIKVESQTLLLDLFMQEMLLQQLKVLMQKNVLLLDQLLLILVKALVDQHQLKLLKQEKNFH